MPSRDGSLVGPTNPQKRKTVPLNANAHGFRTINRAETLALSIVPIYSTEEDHKTQFVFYRTGFSPFGIDCSCSREKQQAEACSTLLRRRIAGYTFPPLAVCGVDN